MGQYSTILESTSPPLGPGLHRIDAELYHSDPCEEPSLSSSLARLILGQSPLHAWTACPRLNPDWEPVEKKTFDIGRAAHREVLCAGSDYVVIPEDILAANGAASTKAAKEFIENARRQSLTPIKVEEANAVRAMASKVHDRLDQVKVWLDTDRSELAAIAEIDGAMCRAMVDNAPEDPGEPLYDFKTTTDASPDAVTRAVMNYGYDVQAAHYLEVWKAATGEDRRFRFIFQEKAAPYEVAVVELHPDSLAMARKKSARAREIWRQCLASGHWPGYPTGVHMIDLPEFFHGRWLERESIEADFRRRAGHDILDQARRWQSPETSPDAGKRT